MPWYGGGGSGGGGSLTPKIDKFTATPGQTVFNLTASPVSAASVIVMVNGKGADPDTEFTLVGNVLTWLNADYSLNGDRLVVNYWI